eukprot:15938710-Heterocapsa_arctica.AAC.1
MSIAIFRASSVSASEILLTRSILFTSRSSGFCASIALFFVRMWNFHSWKSYAVPEYCGTPARVSLKLTLEPWEWYDSPSRYTIPLSANSTK